MPTPLRSKSDVYHLLRERRRRDLLREVGERAGEWVGVDELATALADEERAEGVADTPATVREYLEEVDLVLLNDRGVLEYDLVDDRVRPGAQFETMLAAVEAVDEALAEGHDRAEADLSGGS